MSLAVALASCSKEARADRALADARTEVQRGRIDEAVTALARVVRDYPGTAAARSAQQDLVLYRGLLEAARLDPLRRARDVIVQTARALEAWHARHRAWPDGLAALVPELLPEPPTDPWGHPLDYVRTARGYRLASWGADGREGGEADLVVENGRFVQDPVEGGR